MFVPLEAAVQDRVGFYDGATLFALRDTVAGAVIYPTVVVIACVAVDIALFCADSTFTL